MAIALAQLADLPGVGGRIRLARGKCNLRNRNLTGSVSSSTGRTIARASIQAGLVDDIFLEPFLGDILRRDECTALRVGLPCVEYSLVCRAILARHYSQSERFP